jgi:hypothetical protein
MRGCIIRYFPPDNLGLSRPADAKLALTKFGRNNLSIPKRAFRSLLLEQMTAPFFVFQVFCVVLWMLDEYWHYAVFTLLMLIFFECTVSMTRVNNAKQLEKMEPVPQPVIIWREGKWVQMNNTGADSLEWRLPWRLDGLKWRLNCATWRLSCSK